MKLEDLVREHPFYKGHPNKFGDLMVPGMVMSALATPYQILGGCHIDGHDPYNSDRLEKFKVFMEQFRKSE